MYGVTYDPIDIDRVIDARREAAYDEFLKHAATCVLCGKQWDPIYHAATRYEPAYVEHDECPYCGGDPA